MDSNTTYSTFTSLLLIVAIVLSSGTEGLYLSYGISVSDSSQKASMCKNIDPPLSNELPSELNTGNQDAPIPQSATAIAFSCTMSLQMISVEKQVLLSPTESTMLISAHEAKLSSQVFVFQEPDPPQFS